MVTNLACEHHFGDLDSSQRRRPSASMHHHSSVQLLKRNRKQMFGWLDEMSGSERSELMQKARIGGKDLRNNHISAERKVLTEISEEMLKSGNKRKPSANAKESKKRKKKDKTIMIPPNDYTFEMNEYVAIAYQDSWYPGIVVGKTENECASVKFMTPCRKQGYFQWPARDDIQTVNRKFIISKQFIPDCMNSGRQWFITQFETIQKKYEKFSDLHF